MARKPDYIIVTDPETGDIVDVKARDELKNWKCPKCGALLADCQYKQAVFDNCPKCGERLSTWHEAKIYEKGTNYAL